MIFYCSVPRDVTHSSVLVVNNLKVLGAVWNDKLSWINHFNEILKIASQRLFVVGKFKVSFDEKRIVNNASFSHLHSFILRVVYFCIPSF